MAIFPHMMKMTMARMMGYPREKKALKEQKDHQKEEIQQRAHKNRREALALLSSSPLFVRLLGEVHLFLTEHVRQGDNALELLEYSSMPDM
jgi:hypothetical protein